MHPEKNKNSLMRPNSELNSEFPGIEFEFTKTIPGNSWFHRLNSIRMNPGISRNSFSNSSRELAGITIVPN